MRILVTGGAGYIGGHVARALLRDGHRVTVLDDLSTGDRARVPTAARLIVGDVLDAPLLADVLARGVGAVVHLAGRKSVEESVREPLRYWTQNTVAVQGLLAAMQGAGVRRLVFSSTAAVYGPTGAVPLTEDAPTSPRSPYGRSKLAAEWLIRDQAAAAGLDWAVLRYFNVAGAGAPELGDRGADNLVPRAFRAVAAGVAPSVYGDGYPTPDGTCVRDYVHVEDVADAHAAVVRRMAAGPIGAVYNVGGGRGASVLEVLAAVRSATGSDLSYELAPPREGDAPHVVADPGRIAAELGWHARHDLAATVSSAWRAWTAPADPLRRPPRGRAPDEPLTHDPSPRDLFPLDPSTLGARHASA